MVRGGDDIRVDGNLFDVRTASASGHEATSVDVGAPAVARVGKVLLIRHDMCVVSRRSANAREVVGDGWEGKAMLAAGICRHI